MFITPFTDFIAGDTKAPLLVLLGAVGFRATDRLFQYRGPDAGAGIRRCREVAVGRAGSQRWDLIRQTMFGERRAALVGAALGLAVAFAGVRGLLVFAPENAAVTLDVRMDATVLLFTPLAAIAAGVLSAARRPAHLRLDRFDVLKGGGRSGSAGLRRQRLRAGLVIGEVALCAGTAWSALACFCAAWDSLQDVNPGFQPNTVITASVLLPQTQYGDPAKQIRLYRAVLNACPVCPA